MSIKLATKIRLGLDELSGIVNQMAPLRARTAEPILPVIETAAACAMLHSFYTEIKKILKIIAIELDKKMPSSETGLVAQLSEFLAFRHLFRGASIAPMQWNKLSPLVEKAEGVHQ